MGQLTSIGVSNFNLSDLQELLNVARIKPHLFQGNIYDGILNNELMELLRIHQTRFIAYNILKGIVQQGKDIAPKAFEILEDLKNKVHQQDILNSENSDAANHLKTPPIAKIV